MRRLFANMFLPSVSRRRSRRSFGWHTETVEARVVPAVGGLNTLGLTAAAAIATDDAGNVIGDLNPDETLAMASTTKIMTNLIALEMSAPGNPDGITRADLVTVGWYPARVGGSTTNGAAAPAGATGSDSPLNGPRVGEVFTLQDLIDLSLLSSDNEATQAITEYLISRSDVGQELLNEAFEDFQDLKPSLSVTLQELGGQISSDLDSGIIINNAFAELMNQRAAEMGLTDTSFRNPHGRDPGTVTGIQDYPQSGLTNNGHFTTAAELSELGRQAMQNADFAAIVGPRDAVSIVSTLADGTSNTRVGIVTGNQLVRPGSANSYFGATGVKTGMTAAAGWSLVSQATILGRTVNAVVLDTDSLSLRFQESISILNYGFLNKYGFAVDTVAGVVQTRTSTYDFSDGVLTVNGTDNSDTISIYRYAHEMHISVNGVSEFLPIDQLNRIDIQAGAGNDNILLSGTPGDLPVAILGGAGQDTIRLGTGVGLGVFDSPVFIDGGTTLFQKEQDVLIIDDYGSSSGQSYTIGLDFVARSGQIVGQYSGIERLVVKGTSYADTLELADPSTGPQVELDGRSGSDTLAGPDANMTWNITGGGRGTVGRVSFVAFEHLSGGTGADTFVVSAAGSLAGQMEGGSGRDTLDYSLYGTGVSVSLVDGTATAIAGGIFSIENVSGTRYSDVIVGDNGDNILIGNGGDDVLVGLAGRDKLIASGGRSVLIGGPGMDELLGGRDQDLLIGGSTIYDTDRTALVLLLSAWQNRQQDYRVRITNLTAGVTAGQRTVRLAANTVSSDNEADKLLGADGLDWLWASIDDITDRNPLDEA